LFAVRPFSSACGGLADALKQRLAVNGLLFDPKILLDVLGQSVVDLCMAGYRLFLTGSSIEVNVVAAARAKQNAAMA